jgi:hypothetical protein
MRILLTLLLILAALCCVNAQENDSDEQSADTVKVGAYVISVHDINFHEKE